MSSLFLLKSIPWKLCTAFIKKYILIQDRLGLYSYADWIRDNEPSLQELALQVRLSRDFAYQPLISLLIRADGTPAYPLESTYESLVKQIYTNWEACLVCSTNEGVDWRSALLVDQRIRIQEVAKSSTEGEEWITLLRMSRGEYVQVVNAGDQLSPRWLYEVNRILNSIPETDILYCDEDQVGNNGRARNQPFFKPDWSPELLLSRNYLYHAVFRRSLLLRMIEHSLPENYLHGDLVFRCAEQAHHIHHVPQVLYHRSNTGSGGEASPNPDQHLASVAAHLARCGSEGARASITQNGDIHVAWPDGDAVVSIIIPTKDNVGFLRNCLDSIQQGTAYQNYEIILVDSGSTEQSTHEYYSKLQQLSKLHRVEYSGPFNFNKVLNLGAQQAQGDILLFLNNDTEIIDSDWLGELVGWANRPEVGIVGAKLVYPDAKIQHAGIVIGMEGHGSHIFAGRREGYRGIFGSVDWYRNYSAVTAACMATRREVFDEIGGFDEEYDLAFSDIDICLRAIDAGYRIVYNPFARLIHHEGKTRRRYIPSRDIGVAYQRVKKIVADGDPFFNPNLSYSVRVPTFKRPYEENPIERLENIVRREANT